MKFQVIFLCYLALFPLLASAFLKKKPSTVPESFKKIAYVNSVSSWYGPSILDSFGINSPCYNIIILTFWMPGYVSDALGLWVNIHSNLGTDAYGKTNAEVQKYILDTMHANGKQLWISAFGATGNPSGDPVDGAQNLANFINANPYIDGVDLDYEDNAAVLDGKGVDYIIEFQKALSAKVNNKDLLFTHAPQAPYFSRKHYNEKGYYKVEQEVGNLIAWYNVQFYNQVEDTYSTFETLFIQSPEPFVNTAYKEILDYDNVPLNKLVLGKPATVQDASNTGYVEPAELGNICLRARNELGYELPGFFIWQYRNDQNCSFANSFLNAYFPPEQQKGKKLH